MNASQNSKRFASCLFGTSWVLWTLKIELSPARELNSQKTSKFAGFQKSHQNCPQKGSPKMSHFAFLTLFGLPQDPSGGSGCAPNVPQRAKSLILGPKVTPRAPFWEEICPKSRQKCTETGAEISKMGPQLERKCLKKLAIVAPLISS